MTDFLHLSTESNFQNLSRIDLKSSPIQKNFLKYLYPISLERPNGW